MNAARTARILLFAASLAGCGAFGIGGSPSVVGKWRGKLEIPEAKKNDPEAKLAEAFMGMMGSAISFEFKSDKSFTGSIMFPVEGTYSVNGKTVRLTLTKMMGMTPDASKDPNANKPLEFELSSDGKTMSAIDPKGKGDGGLVLTRE